MDNKLIEDFTKNKLPTKEIAKKYKLTLEVIKKILINNLGREKYLKSAHSIGGITIARKLKNPLYKETYSMNLGKAVSKAIKQKMKNPKFRKIWIEKSRDASKEGRKRINTLLEIDPIFRAKWVKNCAKGGNKTFKLKIGAFDRANIKKRKKGALIGLKNTKRKMIGPKNEKMYNNFERYIANLIIENKLNYFYEKIFPDKNANGFISCDFEINVNNKKLLIEVTCWDKYKDKSLQINKKFQILKNQLVNFEYILVAPTKRQSERYSEFLDKEIICFSSYEFKKELKKIARDGFEFAGNSLKRNTSDDLRVMSPTSTPN